MLIYNKQFIIQYVRYENKSGEECGKNAGYIEVLTSQVLQDN
jgi:hypothetical protein